METTTQIIVTDAIGYGWIPETKQSWIGLKVDEDNTLRLTFADEFPPELKLCLQALQGHVAEERKKANLPVIEHKVTVAVKQTEYWQDPLNQIAGIRTRFVNGGYADVPIAKSQIQQTIEFLTESLRAFENLSKSQKH